MKVNKIIVGVLITIVIAGFFILNQQGNKNSTSQETKQTSKELIPITEITHGHGLAVDIADPTKLYIATHHGLLVLKDEKQLYRVGDAKDDYMGFTPHPADAKIIFSSGHPATGGNIGFQKSEDAGFTWNKISDGIQGPVDFHAMTISPANPKLVYGWFQGALQRSMDEGKTWEVASTTNYPIVNLAADPKDENVVYAATPLGLMVSTNKGKDWTTLFEGFVSVVAISPNDSQKLLSFSEKNRLAVSSDRGKSWEKLSESFSDETPLFIAFNKQNPETVYILTEKNSIYKSSDSGDSWSKIR
ncbi:MAG TPA: hypothetical protein VJC10_01650 [Patescibacteria group bacterium]|nr:hypothetical protein [Patescibacteria group bacterium]